ncbi:putative Mg2+ transporter-C (MgtC) family protein [Paenibacillus cellulosilyticus]|uniref:Putative Mg2+ transporter-C (MgtC) family protein n=1 Tax=Paenibacillus cellulosilyticus TaxID=375489 RepID=A0A2V2YNZ0_9BACL|nr:MgtC/SapB family protein [Paenibacillus cellulosilyticus]PWV94420.1 putative Mg2+ transporter-C (MgtC) family protein [Paenibacillus cellulosilyticus]QKS43912.1 MgtC/SapB family protein [Paenibacillus cellulosilyticus]
MTLDYTVKLAAALILGLLIGVDRQLRHKPLGMKTSMVIAVASCLITIVSIEASGKLAHPGMTNMDPMRLAAQIISGVGFIGAGVILRRSNDVISGLTTAAMVWSASALGIAAGAGFYKEAFTAVCFIIVAVNLVPFAVRAFGPSKLREKDISVCLIVDMADDLADIMASIRGEHQVKHTKIRDRGDGHKEICLVLSSAERYPTVSVYERMKQLKPVISVEVESISS